VTEARPTSLPLPPDDLLRRVGPYPVSADEARAAWLETGREGREGLLGKLPAGWSFVGKTVLEFGCGAGRMLRHLLPEAEQAEAFYACDVHGASVAWVDAHLCPPFRVFESGSLPPLPLADASVDLVYASSVFTHLTDTAAAWLLELRRVLRPDGLLFATYQGSGYWEMRGDAADLPDLEDVGRTVWGHGKSFADSGGPDCFMATWWIREHWGRAFDIEELSDAGLAFPRILGLSGRGQGYVLMRPNGKDCTPEQLEAPNPDDERELRGLVLDRKLMLAELGYLRPQAVRAQAELDRVARSRSWRLTAPLRHVRRVLGRAAVGARPWSGRG
jgi:SAM-dependent methyltransferase